jgi:hypothetical protein
MAGSSWDDTHEHDLHPVPLAGGGELTNKSGPVYQCRICAAVVVLIACSVCGKSKQGRDGDEVARCMECEAAGRWSRPTCPVCAGVFDGLSRMSVYCSDRCKGRAARQRRKDRAQAAGGGAREGREETMSAAGRRSKAAVDNMSRSVLEPAKGET